MIHGARNLRRNYGMSTDITKICLGMDANNSADGAADWQVTQHFESHVSILKAFLDRKIDFEQRGDLVRVRVE
jgi:hypothetical protein